MFLLLYPLLSISSSLHSVEPEAVWVWLGEVRLCAGAPRQPAHRSPGDVGREGQRQGHAVPRQHRQRGRTETLPWICVPVREGADAGWRRSDRAPIWSSGAETWDVWKQTGSEARHQRTLHSSDGVLTCTRKRPGDFSMVSHMDLIYWITKCNPRNVTVRSSEKALGHISFSPHSKICHDQRSILNYNYCFAVLLSKYQETVLNPPRCLWLGLALITALVSPQSSCAVTVMIAALWIAIG